MNYGNSKSKHPLRCFPKTLISYFILTLREIAILQLIIIQLNILQAYQIFQCGWKISYHTSFLFYNLIRLIYIKKISKVFTQKNKNKKTRPIILYHALFLQDYQITSPHKNLYLLNQQNSISQRFAILPVRKNNYFFCFFFLDFFFFWYKLN